MQILNQHIRHEIIVPEGTSGQFIERCFVVNSATDKQVGSQFYKVVPRAQPVLIVKRDELTGNVQSSLAGPQLWSIEIPFNPNEQWCIAELKAGALFTLFGVAGRELRNKVHYLRELDPILAPAIETAFAKDFTPHQFDELFHKADLTLKLGRELEYALDILSSPQSQFTVKDLSIKSGLHTRRLQRQFDQLIGISPKQYQTIIRLRSALEMAAYQHNSTWTEIALLCGYYDQPHLTNDMTRLLAIRPSEISRLIAA